MAKTKEQKKKDREKKVAQKKLAETAKRREIAKKSDATGNKGPRAAKVLTAGVKQQQKNQKSQVGAGKPAVVNRRTGG